VGSTGSVPRWQAGLTETIKFIYQVLNFLIPNPDEPKQIATKAPGETRNFLINIHLCVFVSGWRNCFAIKCKEFTTQTLIEE